MGAGAPPPLPGAEAISTEGTGYLDASYHTEERRWAERHLVKPAIKQWGEAPWASEAASFCRVGLDTEMQGYRKNLKRESLALVAAQLLEAGCDDPLVCYLAAIALEAKSADWRKGEPWLLKAAEKCNDPARVCGALALMILRNRVSMLEYRGVEADEPRRLLLAAMKRALADASYGKESNHILARDFIEAFAQANLKDAAEIDDLISAVDRCPHSTWLKNTLKGSLELQHAWAARGSGVATTVSPAQYQSFRARLKAARTALEAAWQERPDLPEPAAAMIRVSMGEEKPKTEPRLWFNRAVAAQFDYLTAYENLAYAFRPRWGGSHQLMVQFATACAGTGRFDTQVPLQALMIAREIAQERNSTSQVFESPELAAPLKSVVEGYLNQPGLTSRQTNRFASYGAAAAYMMVQPELCMRAVQAAGSELHPSAIKYLNSMQSSDGQMLLETAASLGELGPEMQQLSRLLNADNYEKALELVRTTSPAKLRPDARPFFEELAGVLTLPEKFEKGGPVPLVFNPGLLSFRQNSPQWSSNAEHQLLATGDDSLRTECCHVFPVRSETFEVRAELSLDLPDPAQVRDSCAFGLLIGWVPKATGGQPGIRALIQHSNKATWAYLESVHSGTRCDEQKIKLAKNNQLRLTLNQGLITFEINGQVIAKDRSITELGEQPVQGSFGFTTLRLPKGAVLKWSKAVVSKTPKP